MAAEKPLKPSTVPWSNEVSVSGVMMAPASAPTPAASPNESAIAMRGSMPHSAAASRLRGDGAHGAAEHGALEEPVRGEHDRAA